MKHIPDSQDEARKIANFLKDHALRHGLSLSTEQAERLVKMIQWLAPAAFKLGLTKYGEPLEMMKNLVAPSLLLLKEINRQAIGQSLIDFGAGSGAVGLSLAIFLEDRKITLADRRHRVIQFLETTRRRFGLYQCEARLIDLRRPEAWPRERYNTALIRAFGPPQQALTLAVEWLEDGGTIALWTQPPPPRAPEGLRLIRTDRTDIPSLALCLYQRLSTRSKRT